MFSNQRLSLSASPSRPARAPVFRLVTAVLLPSTLISLLLGPAAVVAAPTSTAAQTPILPPLAPWEGKSQALALPADHEWATPFETSGHTSSPPYDETVAWLEKLASAAPQIQMVPVGTSGENRTLWMVVASEDGSNSPARLRESGKPIVLVQAGIHSGEIDGKDAGMMLLRDMTVVGTKRSLLEGAHLLFVPIFNVDGHERSSPHGRINQRGPSEMGWRTNGRNLNLNRDYGKLETPELRAMVAVINEWQPDLYIDVHVTDGVDYQYDVTFGYNGPHAWSPKIATWLDEHFTPRVRQDLEKMGHVPGRLIFGANWRDLTEGAWGWTGMPRFSNGYGDARHLPTVLVENHSLKPFDRRVFGTYVFLESTLRVLAEQGTTLRAATEEDRLVYPDTVTVDWDVAADEAPKPEPFRGIRSELFLSPVTGNPQVRWTGEPIEEDVAWYEATAAVARVRRPLEYIIPAPWADIADRLALHGIEMVRSSEGFTKKVQMYRLPEAKLEGEPYEGRVRVTPGEIQIEELEVEFPPGSYTVSTHQPLGDLAILLLEPRSEDSFFQWGYFLEILQRTEYVEGYVMEPMARAMMEEDPELAALFQQKLLDDSEFAGHPRARLQFFYERTPFYDERWRLYPVARSLE